MERGNRSTRIIFLPNANHLSANDYYSESEKIVGHWRGILSFDFDLVSREVDMESFSMFQRGINPVTGGKSMCCTEVSIYYESV